MTFVPSTPARNSSRRTQRAGRALAAVLALGLGPATLANRSWSPGPFAPGGPAPGVAPADASALRFSRAALAPPDARMVIHLHRAAELRRALHEHPVGRAVDAFIADPQIAAAWGELAEGLDLDQMALLDQLLGRDATLVVRGEGPTLEWTLITSVDDATIGLLGRALGPKLLGGGWHHLVRQRIVFNRWNQMAVIGPAPGNDLTREVWSLVRNDGGPRLANLPALGFLGEMQQTASSAVNDELGALAEFSPFGPEAISPVSAPDLPRVELLMRTRATSLPGTDQVVAAGTDLPWGWTAVVATLQGETIELQQRSLFDGPCLPARPDTALDPRLLERLSAAGAVAVLGRSSESPLGAMMLTLLPSIADDSIASLVRGVPQLLIVAPSDHGDSQPARTSETNGESTTRPPAPGSPSAASSGSASRSASQSASGPGTPSGRMPFALVLEAQHSTDEAIRLQEESLRRSGGDTKEGRDGERGSDAKEATDEAAAPRGAWLEMLEGNVAGEFPRHSSGRATPASGSDELLVVAGLDGGRTIIANDADQLRRLLDELRARESRGLRLPDAADRTVVCVDAGIVPGSLLAAGLRRADQMHLLDAALAAELAAEPEMPNGAEGGDMITVAHPDLNALAGGPTTIQLLASLADGLRDLRWRLHQIGDRSLRLDATFRLAPTPER